ncbi:DgyrCDS7385 [Dimorphilus gyrociliatus]|uniref:3'(2'),5'-bisphosphate nucleotidase 1 n=1 Tax=Dimorphilus gyrociliatus TaxID=2664684 RepID=A0A7I8VT43_9ANNE|nr:DgyrCDS7385 [Dimorphilus gyrociliatus]
MSGRIVSIMSQAVQAAKKSGSIIRNLFQEGKWGIVNKGKNDLQTEADRSAQRCIMASLKKRYPKVTMIGEEELDSSQVPEDWIELSQSEEVLSTADRLPDKLKNVTDDQIIIWIDPLDGTAEYTQGLLDHVTVLIGVTVNGEAVGGVIYQPYFNYKAGPDAELGRTIWGIVGVGAYGIPQPTVPPSTGRIITTTRSHSSGSVKAAVDSCEPTEVIKVGGAGHKVLLLIEGKAHAYVFASPGCKKWDTAAPEAVLKAAGGKLTDIRGVNIPYEVNVPRRNSSGVLATCLESEHTWYLNKIPDEVKNDLKAD